MVHISDLISDIIKAIDANLAIFKSILKDQFEKLILWSLLEIR